MKFIHIDKTRIKIYEKQKSRPCKFQNRLKPKPLKNHYLLIHVKT